MWSLLLRLKVEAYEKSCACVVQAYGCTEISWINWKQHANKHWKGSLLLISRPLPIGSNTFALSRGANFGVLPKTHALFLFSIRLSGFSVMSHFELQWYIRSTLRPTSGLPGRITKRVIMQSRSKIMNATHPKELCPLTPMLCFR